MRGGDETTTEGECWRGECSSSSPRNITVDLIEFGVSSDGDERLYSRAPLLCVAPQHGAAQAATDGPVTFRRGADSTGDSAAPGGSGAQGRYVQEGLEVGSVAARESYIRLPFANSTITRTRSPKMVATPPPIDQRGDKRTKRKFSEKTGRTQPNIDYDNAASHERTRCLAPAEELTVDSRGTITSREDERADDMSPSRVPRWQKLMEADSSSMAVRGGKLDLKHREMELQHFTDHDTYWASSSVPAVTKSLARSGSLDNCGPTHSEKSDVAQSGCLDRCGLLRVLLDKPFLTALFVFLPVGFLSNYYEWPDYVTFWTNFVAVIPQAWLMGKATEDLAAHMGQVTGGLLNAWFGNVVEMLLCIAGLRAGQLIVVKATLVGSILSNLLLVTGCSFLFGGLKHKVQEFSAIGASTNASLMTLSCLCLGLPTMYGTINASAVTSELNISRATSFLLVFIYAQYLVFQLGTHSFLFEEGEDEEAELSVTTSALTLGFCTAACTFSSEFLIHSIEGTVDTLRISKSFIGIILLPIIGNAAEHYTSVIVAVKNKMDLSLACAVGSSCQMALFVTPFTVLVGWAIGQPMSLDLNAFEMLVLVLAVLIVTSILQDGYSHWLEGSMLLSAYLVIALIYFFEDPN